jgi:quercetin dioxygenase-like cupin family protein
LVNGYGISSDDSIAKLVERLETNSEHNSLSDDSADGPTMTKDAELALNATFIEMNLDELIKQSKNESAWATTDRNTTIIFRSETMRIVLIGLRGNAELKPHKTNGVISLQALEGRLVFSTEERSTEMGKGQMIALNANILHSVRAINESWFLLTIAMLQET